VESKPARLKGSVPFGQRPNTCPVTRTNRELVESLPSPREQKLRGGLFLDITSGT
jgi:hypothetical protein